MKALLDLGQPFISLECHSDNSDNSPIEGIPLLLLSQTHSTKLSRNPQISDKIALLLSRGANVRATNALGKSCLHLIWIHHCHDKDSCWSRDEEKVRRHLCRTIDIANLMISAGADVCAIDEEGRSVSDIAKQSGQQALWTEALKYCGIDIKDVLAQRNSNPAYSTALSPEYSQPSRSVMSKISLKQYLERRKAFCVPEEDEEKYGILLDSSEEDDSSEDEDLDSEVASIEADENEDAEWEDADSAEESSETADVSQKKATGEIGGNHVQYEGEIAKGKAKLD